MRPRRQVRRFDTRPRYTRSANTGRVPIRPTQPGRVSSGRGGGLPSISLPRIQLPAIKIGWLLWAGIAVVIVTVLVVLGNFTRIQQVQVQGNKNLNAVHVQQLAEEGMKKQWFGNNILLVQTGALTDFLQQQEPAIKTATISRSSNHAITIKIQERQPTLNWRSGNSLYLLDADGTVIGPSQGAYETSLPTVIDGSSLPVEEGKRVVPASFISFTSQMIAQLPAIGVKIVAVTVPETTSELLIKTDKGYTIKFDTTRAVAGELDDLKMVLKELERSNKTPKEYVDLRIENKAYYK